MSPTDRPLPAYARVHLNGHLDLGPCAVRLLRASADSLAGPAPAQGVFLVEATSLETGAVTLFPPASIYRLETIDAVEARRATVVREIKYRQEVSLAAALRGALASCRARVRRSAQGAWCVRVDLELGDDYDHKFGYLLGATGLLELLELELWSPEVGAECVVKQVSRHEKASITFEVTGVVDLALPASNALARLGFGEVTVAADPDPESAPFDCFSDDESPF